MKKITTMTKKRFDCVAMKRRGAARVYRQIKGMTIPEEVAYWAERTAAMKGRRYRSPRPQARHRVTA